MPEGRGGRRFRGLGPQGVKETPRRLQFFDRASARHGTEAGRRRSRAQLSRLLGESPFLREHRGAPIRRREEVEERKPGEPLILAANGVRGPEPPPQLPPAGGGHPIEVAPGAPAGSEDLQEHPARPAQAGERRIDLGVFGSPDVVEILPHRALQLVTGPRFFGEKAQEHMGKRHEATISK